MNIFAQIAALSLNYFAIKLKQTKTPLALAVIIAQKEYSLLSPLFLTVVKGHLFQSEAVHLVVLALPQVATPAKYSYLEWED